MNLLVVKVRALFYVHRKGVMGMFFESLTFVENLFCVAFLTETGALPIR